MSDHSDLDAHVRHHRDRHLRLLRDGCRISFGGLSTFQSWLGERIESLGGTLTEFSADEDRLHDQPAYRASLAADPDSIRRGPNVVGTDFFDGPSSSVLLYGHADKNPDTDEYVDAGHGVETAGDRVLGPGIADDVSGLTAILSALETVQTADLDPAHAVVFASVLGKQSGVAGTHELVRRRDPTDHAVYVHPSESGGGLSEIKVGSNGILEFALDVTGVDPDTGEPHHPLFVGPGDNPLALAAHLTRHLQSWVGELGGEYHHAGVEDLAGRSTGLLVSDVDVDSPAVYQVPESCRLRGVVSFPPSGSLDAVEASLQQAVSDFVAAQGLPSDRVTVEWGDVVADSAETDVESPIAETTADVLRATTGTDPSWYYGHTTSDIRYPMHYWGTETLGFGPRAGAMGRPDEWVDSEEYLETVTALARLLTTDIE